MNINHPAPVTPPLGGWEMESGGDYKSRQRPLWGGWIAVTEGCSPARPPAPRFEKTLQDFVLLSVAAFPNCYREVSLEQLS